MLDKPVFEFNRNDFMEQRNLKVKCDSVTFLYTSPGKTLNWSFFIAAWMSLQRTVSGQDNGLCGVHGISTPGVLLETKTIDFQTSVAQFSDRRSHHRFEFFPKHSHTNHIFCRQHFLRLFVITNIYFVLKGAVNKEWKNRQVYYLRINFSLAHQSLN